MLMERLSVDYGKKSKLEFAVSPEPEVRYFGDSSYIVSNVMTLHTVFGCHVWCNNFAMQDFCRCISLTGSTLQASEDSSEKGNFQSLHIFVTHLCKHVRHNTSVKNGERHVHRPPATILHSMTNCAIDSQSFLLRNFVFRQLRRQNAPLQTTMDKMHTMDSLL